MTKIALLSGVALLALSSSAFAADLIINEPAAPIAMAPAYDSNMYIQLLGGAALEGTIDYTVDEVDATDDLNSGWAVAGVLGFGTGIEGLSIEGDLFYASRDASDDDYTVTTGSAMAALKYTVNLNDTFAVYGAAGLGGVYLHDEYDDGEVAADGWGAGYVLKAGITAKVAESISLVGEVRYTDSFDKIDGEQAGTTAVLAGLHFGF